MTISHHPDDSTIAAYCAGTLSESFSLLIAAHMESCEECQQKMLQAHALAGEMLMDLEPSDMPSGGLDDIWGRIESSDFQEETTVPADINLDSSMPAVLQSVLEQDLDSIPWKKLAPGIQHFPINNIDSEKGTIRLLSIEPGVTIPEHTHGGSELTLVLRGSYRDEIGHYKSGDLADLDSSTIHQPVAYGNKNCICLISTDKPLRFSGIVSRMLQPVFGM